MEKAKASNKSPAGWTHEEELVLLSAAKACCVEGDVDWAKVDAKRLPPSKTRTKCKKKMENLFETLFQVLVRELAEDACEEVWTQAQEKTE